MATPSDEMNTKLTWRRFEDGQNEWDSFTDKIFNEDLPAYWEARGWTTDKGIPTVETLKELGIDDIAEEYVKALL